MAGFETEVVFEPPSATETPDVSGVFQRIRERRCSVVFFQKVRGPHVVNLVRELEAAGVRTVFLTCDLVDAEMCEATTATIVVTDYLRELYPAAMQHKVYVVHDGIERPDVVAARRPDNAGVNSPLRAVLVTSARVVDLPVLGLPPRWLHVTVVGNYPDEADVQERLRRWRWALLEEEHWSERLRMLRALVSRRIRRVPWSPIGVYEELSRADVAIIPIDKSHDFGPNQPVWKLKSENRLTLKMAIGLPVVATPIPAYEPVITHGIDGFFARTRSEWLEALSKLRSAKLRRQIGSAARTRVLEAYSVQRQAKRLLAVIEDVVAKLPSTRD